MTPETIFELLQPYIQQIEEPAAGWPHVCSQLKIYLDLILKWNSRTNLTAIRDAEGIVRRHFGESLLAGAYIGESASLLDFGSGAGFPGVPIQLLRPEIAVTLAESQGKKAAFLREVCRELHFSTEVYSRRVETIPLDCTFDCVTLRAVDNMEAACAEAFRIARFHLIALTTRNAGASLKIPASFRLVEKISLPESQSSVILIYTHVAT